jgi:hypothetical protein
MRAKRVMSANLPRNKTEGDRYHVDALRPVELRASELAMMLDGIDMTKLKRTPRYRRTNASNNEKVAS